MIYDIKTIDNYSMAMIEAFDTESRKYLNKINNEDLVKLEKFNFDSRKYFGKLGILKQESIDDCYKAKFFSVFANKLSNIYHESALQSYSIDMRFAEMEKHIFNLIKKAGQVELSLGNYLHKTTFGIHEWREEREYNYYYWGADLDKKLLLEAYEIIKKVKVEVDLLLNEVDPQKNTSNNSNNCFIVTATFGTPYAKEVIKYRNFRDKYLSKYLLGRIFVYLYNFWGPSLAVIVKRNSKLKDFMVKILGAVSQILPEIDE